MLVEVLFSLFFAVVVGLLFKLIVFDLKGDLSSGKIVLKACLEVIMYVGWLVLLITLVADNQVHPYIVLKTICKVMGLVILFLESIHYILVFKRERRTRTAVELRDGN